MNLAMLLERSRSERKEKSGSCDCAKRGDHRADRDRGLGILDAQAGVAERIPGADAVFVQRDHALGRQRQQLHHQRADAGQARGPARQQQHVAIVGVHDLGERRQHAAHLGAHRLVDARQVDREHRGLEVEVLGAALARGLVDEGDDFLGRLGAVGEEGIVGARLGGHDARGRVVGLGGAQEFQRDRMGDLQRELLAQVALDHVLAAAVAAHQLGHQVGRDWRCRRRASPPRSAAARGPARRAAGCRRRRR